MKQPISEVTCEDCMEMMSRYPDKYFDLAIVDPPYGLSIAKNGRLHNNSKYDRGFKKNVDYGAVAWDGLPPDKQYFQELQRVSKRQIIWGANFFLEHLQNTRCVVVWDKRGKDKNPNFSPFEFAWTNFDILPKIYEYGWLGFGYINSGEKKIHPTQKPVFLYHSLLTDFAKRDDKILDTHLGSGSSRIAAYKLGFDFWACEIDPDYFKQSCERFEATKSMINTDDSYF